MAHLTSENQRLQLKEEVRGVNMITNSLSNDRKKIIEEANLYDDTFLFLLYREQYFDGDKYSDLVDCILEIYKQGIVDYEIKNSVCIFLRAVQLCVVSHLDVNDLYKIKGFDMNEWNEIYRDKFDEVLETAVVN